MQIQRKEGRNKGIEQASGKWQPCESVDKNEGGKEMSRNFFR